MGILDRFFKVKEGGQALVKLGKSVTSSILSENSFEYDYQARAERFKQYLRAYERVPLITAIIDVQVNQVVQEYYFDDESLEEWDDEVNLTCFFQNITKCGLIWGNGYSESVFAGSKIVELKVLNPIWMDVWRNDIGDITGYTQIINDKKCVLWGTTGDKTFDADFITKIPSIDTISHFKFNRLASEKYGRSLIEPLMSSLQAKLDMELDLRKVLFKYVAPLIWAKVGNDQMPANDTHVSDVSSTLKNLSAQSEVTTTHLVDLSVLDFNAKGMDIATPINHIEQQIITGGQTPPVLLGIGGSDKADAEVQLRAFGRRIKSLQRELKAEFEDNIIKGNKIFFERAEEREWEMEVDLLRGLVTDGIITPQKANDLLPARYRETLPEVPDLLNGQEVGADGVQKPRASQKKNSKITDNPNNPTKTTKDKKTLGKRVNKTDREVPVK